MDEVKGRIFFFNSVLEFVEELIDKYKFYITWRTKLERKEERDERNFLLALICLISRLMSVVRTVVWPSITMIRDDHRTGDD